MVQWFPIIWKLQTPQQFFCCSFNNQIELPIAFYCIVHWVTNPFQIIFFLSLVNEIVYHFNAVVFWMFLSKIFKHVRFLSSLWVSSSNVVVFCNYNKFPLIGNSSTVCTSSTVLSMLSLHVGLIVIELHWLDRAVFTLIHRRPTEQKPKKKKSHSNKNVNVNSSHRNWLKWSASEVLCWVISILPG